MGGVRWTATYPFALDLLMPPLCFCLARARRRRGWSKFAFGGEGKSVVCVGGGLGLRYGLRVGELLGGVWIRCRSGLFLFFLVLGNFALLAALLLLDASVFGAAFELQAAGDGRGVVGGGHGGREAPRARKHGCGAQ